jgi:hypothetical protein
MGVVPMADSGATSDENDDVVTVAFDFAPDSAPRRAHMLPGRVHQRTSGDSVMSQPDSGVS